MTSWRAVRVEDVALVYDGPHATPVSPKTAVAGPLFLGISSLQNGRLDLLQSGFLSDDDFARWTRRVSPQADDVVFSYETRIGQAAIIPTGLRCALGRRLALMRPDRRVIDPRFLLYSYLGPTFQETLRLNTIAGSTVDRILLRDFPKFPLLLPSLAEQRGIAATLGALDDKVESNRRSLTLMVDLAQSVLLGGGVERVRLGDVATLDKGVSYQGAGLVDRPSTSARPLINLGNFPINSAWLNKSKTKHYSGDYRARHVVQAGDLVVANTDLTQQRAVLGRGGLVPPGLGPSLITHHVFAIRFHARQELRLPLWAQLASASARDRLTGYATGTTVAGLPREALLDFVIAVPKSGDVITTAEALVAAAWARDSESASLIALRDALLPELLSGRIRVPEASEAIDDVLG